jgi:hypothetical protein
MKKTGNTLFTSCIVWLVLGMAALPAASRPARAAEGDIQFGAKVDRSQISLDESVSLKFTVQSEGGGSQVSQPRFQAPDFDVVNQYNGTHIESYYDGNTGQFGMRNNQQITQVLRPSKTGALRITGISINAGGKTYTAPDITVQVLGAGAGTPPPRGYGGGGIGLRGAGKKLTGPSIRLRAEVNKTKAYKGEQIIVSYYLYRRVRVFNINVDKFPILTGFLREDLEMPVLGQRLDTERVAVDGVPYERSLLLRYAAYPLQEGKLNIDSISLKYAYYPNSSSMDDEDPFMGFFRQMQPQQGQERSEQLPIEVMPLPEEGKPNSFTGGVGDFNLIAAADKIDVRANEAVTLTAKLEGRGNLAAIGEPKAKWPEGLEIYDSKGVAKSGPGGVGQKVFEFTLIPRIPGKLTLPALELSYFDPTQSRYVTRKTEPIVINVGEPVPGSTPAGLNKNSSGSSNPKTSDPATQSGASSEPAGFKSATDTGAPRLAIPVWRWLYWLCSLVFVALTGLVLWDLFRKTQARSSALADARAKAHSRSWARLRESARQAAAGAAWQEVLISYELLTGVIFDAIDRAYSIGARSRPRSQLKEILVDERGLSAEAWAKISRLLEYAELVRFASAAGAISDQAARKDLARWVEEGEAVAHELEQVR